MNDRPLAGLSVVVVRDDAPDDDVSAAIVARGGTVVPLPLMAIAPPQTDAALAAFADGCAQLERYDVVAFSSRHAVDAVCARCPRPSANAIIAAVGPATAARLRHHGWRVDVVGDAGGRALAARLAQRGVSGQAVFLPQAEDANGDLERGLVGAGARVDAVVAYRSVDVGTDADVDRAIGAAAGAGAWAIVFTSPKRLRRFVALASTDVGDGAVVVIGDTTAKAAADVGLAVDAVAAGAGPIPVCEALMTLHTPR